MSDPAVNGHRQRASDIQLVDATNGKRFPCAPLGSVMLSSVPFGWRGIIVERHRLEAQELPQHYVVGHGISVSTSMRPVPFGWRGANGWREGVLNPADFHLLTDGELNTPRWLDTFDQVSLVLEPRFVAGIVRDGLPADRVEFVTHRSRSDTTIAWYTDAFLSELATDCSNGPLYAGDIDRRIRASFAVQLCRVEAEDPLAAREVECVPTSHGCRLHPVTPG
jgi:hypothetical protein